MSKKHKSNRKQMRKPAKKAAAPPTAMKTKNGRERQVVAATSVHRSGGPAPAPTVQPVAVADERRTLPFWARMPFAIADFWFSRREPRAR
jgi:hypothetical protein